LLNAFIVERNLDKKKDITPANIVKDAFAMHAILMKHLDQNVEGDIFYSGYFLIFRMFISKIYTNIQIILHI